MCLTAPEFWRHPELVNDRWRNYGRNRLFVHLARLAGHPLSLTLDAATTDRQVAELFRSVVHLVQDLEVRSWTVGGNWLQHEFPCLEASKRGSLPFAPHVYPTHDLREVEELRPLWPHTQFISSFAALPKSHHALPHVLQPLGHRCPADGRVTG